MGPIWSETLCRPDCWHVINLPSTCHPKCQLLWRGPSCCYRPHGSDSQRKHGQARLRSDVRQRRATGKPCSQVLTQRYRDNSWHRFGAWERRWNQRSRGNSSDCLFYSWVAGSLNGPKPFKRRPRNEAWSSMAYSMDMGWHGLSEDRSRMTSSWLFFLVLLHFWMSWTWTFLQNHHLQHPWRWQKILTTIPSKRSNSWLCFSELYWLLAAIC